VYKSIGGSNVCLLASRYKHVDSGLFALGKCRFGSICTGKMSFRVYLHWENVVSGLFALGKCRFGAMLVMCKNQEKLSVILRFF
jgi:hypothetical protein